MKSDGGELVKHTSYLGLSCCSHVLSGGLNGEALLQVSLFLSLVVTERKKWAARSRGFVQVLSPSSNLWWLSK